MLRRTFRPWYRFDDFALSLSLACYFCVLSSQCRVLEATFSLYLWPWSGARIKPFLAVVPDCTTFTVGSVVVIHALFVRVLLAYTESIFPLFEVIGFTLVSVVVGCLYLSQLLN